jgi:hypothetical protein
MGLFDTECKYCKSKEHTSEECTHNKDILFGDTECFYCQSNNHSSDECPHDKGILFGDTKCYHCNSREHSSENCPHDKGILLSDTECKYCNSKNHSNSNCPHEKSILGGVTRCKYCNSRDHASRNCPHNRKNVEMSDWIGKLLGYVVVIAGICWLAFKVALPLLVINLSVISLLISLFFKKTWRKFLLPISVFGVILIMLDYNKGWLTKSVVESVEFLNGLITPLFYLNIIAGLIAMYYLIDDYYLKTNQNSHNKLFKNKTQNIVFGSLIFLGIGVFSLQKFVLDKIKYENITEPTIENTTNNISENQQQNETSELTNNYKYSKDDLAKEMNHPDNAVNEEVAKADIVNNGNFNEICKANLRNLIQAEDNRSFNSIYSYMSPNIEKYWDADNPSQEELYKRYNAVWNKLTASSNIIDSINTIDNNIYDLYNTFTFTGKKSGETKTINSVVRFKFDLEGKIIYINGIK